MGPGARRRLGLGAPFWIRPLVGPDKGREPFPEEEEDDLELPCFLEEDEAAGRREDGREEEPETVSFDNFLSRAEILD